MVGVVQKGECCRKRKEIAYHKQESGYVTDDVGHGFKTFDLYSSGVWYRGLGNKIHNTVGGWEVWDNMVVRNSNMRDNMEGP
jgi:hypothetical protein